MEKIIIITLLVTIILILWDRRLAINDHAKKSGNSKKIEPSIMGDTKQGRRQGLPMEATQGHFEPCSLGEGNFESETKDNVFEDIQDTITLPDISIKVNDWDEEEEDWKDQDSQFESGFASGVTFQELSTAGQLLQEELPEPDLEQQAVNIIQKIQGTELFELLENSLEDASRRIADLLNRSISNTDIEGASYNKGDIEGFDIGNFI